MSQFAAATTLRRLKNNNGIVGGLPRIYNTDRATYWYGYAEVNVAAASPFTRTKVHDGRFEGTCDIIDGDLILDRYDGSEYLVMSTKGIYGGGANGKTCYYDATLYKVSATATITRLDTSTFDPYGRPSNALTTVGTAVKILVNPQNFGTTPTDGEVFQDNKIKVVLQSKVGLKINDRITTSVGDVLVVDNIDKSSLNNLWIAMCNADVR